MAEKICLIPLQFLEIQPAEFQTPSLVSLRTGSQCPPQTLAHFQGGPSPWITLCTLGAGGPRLSLQGLVNAANVGWLWERVSLGLGDLISTGSKDKASILYLTGFPLRPLSPEREREATPLSSRLGSWAQEGSEPWDFFFQLKGLGKGKARVTVGCNLNLP